MANAIIVPAEATCREAMTRAVVTKASDPYAEVPSELKAWGDLYYGGSGPLEHARRYPNQWFEAFLLTYFEVAALVFCVRLSPEEPPWAVRYDSASSKYLAYPLRKMGKRHGLMAVPHPWHHLYWPLLRKAFRPFRTTALRIGNAIAIASDVATQVVEVVWGAMHMSRRVA
ncbi:MAG: hypothetical protein QG615_515 [Nitrospirota bacterium]|nr:hypothetical protein [Nitrospirota bacterium]